LLCAKKYYAKALKLLICHPLGESAGLKTRVFKLPQFQIIYLVQVLCQRGLLCCVSDRVSVALVWKMSVSRRCFCGRCCAALRLTECVSINDESLEIGVDLGLGLWDCCGSDRGFGNK
jgi:hypothetical protein